MEEWKIAGIVKLSNQYHKKGDIIKISNYGRCSVNDVIIDVKLQKTQKYLRFYGKFIHRWVAELFLPNTRNVNHVDHIDGNRLNNHYTNLRWVTQEENNQNPITRKRFSEGQKRSKLCKQHIDHLHNKNKGTHRVYNDNGTWQMIR